MWRLVPDPMSRLVRHPMSRFVPDLMSRFFPDPMFMFVPYPNPNQDPDVSCMIRSLTMNKMRIKMVNERRMLRINLLFIEANDGVGV